MRHFRNSLLDLANTRSLLGSKTRMAFMSVGLAVVVVVVAYAAAVLSIVIVVCMFGERREFVDLSSDFAFDSDFHDSDVGLIANLLTY